MYVGKSAGDCRLVHRAKATIFLPFSWRPWTLPALQTPRLLNVSRIFVLCAHSSLIILLTLWLLIEFQYTQTR